MEDRNLSLSEVAGSLGVSERTVRRWIQSGRLKAYKPGRDYRIPEAALREFVEGSEVLPKVSRRLSPELSFNDVLDEERREATYEPWLDFVNRYVDQWEERIATGKFDLGSVNEFIEILEALMPTLEALNSREQEGLPKQEWSFGQPAAKTGTAIGRLLGFFGPLAAAAGAKFEDSDLEQLRRKRAEQEAAHSDLVRRGA